MEALQTATVRVVAVIAEGVPEKDTKRLIAYARANNKVIIGPATVGGVQVGPLPGHLVAWLCAPSTCQQQHWARVAAHAINGAAALHVVAEQRPASCTCCEISLIAGLSPTQHLLRKVCTCLCLHGVLRSHSYCS